MSDSITYNEILDEEEKLNTHNSWTDRYEYDEEGLPNE